MHPEASRKIGVGIDHFRIDRNALGAGRGGRLVRLDGSEDSFSYKRCVTGAVQSRPGKVCEALRFALRPQLIAGIHSGFWSIKPLLIRPELEKHWRWWI
ncbi:DCL family protein [Pseudomonas sp. NPDC089530]|uniref:DCL family protein n=1 Tax=Pseudomonas sp. NPDC089530 TaxID=3390651 RepID=UPI003D03B0BF